jgi:hypothetical protein
MHHKKHHGMAHHQKHHKENQHHGEAKNAKGGHSLDQEKEHGEGGSLTKGTGKKGQENRTGEITHGIAFLNSVSGKDQHASADFHSHNKHHGMHDGFAPKENNNKGPMDPEGNEECC